LSQRDLSSPGVSYAYISRIEAGARTPSVKALRKLAQKLEVSVEYLETGRDIRDVDDRELRLADAELELRLAQDVASAERKLEGILEEAQKAGDAGSAVRARIALGIAAAERGSNLEAAERLEAASSDEAAPAPHLAPNLYTTLGRSYAALGAPDRAVLDDPVRDVDEPDRAEREAPVAHPREVQRERDDMQVARRQLVAQAKAADLRYAARWAGSISTSGSSKVRSVGISPIPRRTNVATAARGRRAAGSAVSRTARGSPSRPEQALAAHAHHVAVDAGGGRAREPRHGLGDVDRQPALAQAVHAPPRLA
jgi:transcriptional regulator with XRE-family HTH domain